MPKKGASEEWINNTFLEKVLTSSQADKNIKVTSYEIGRATAAGDNYASEMYRVTVQYQRKGKQETTSLIVKAEPTKEEMCKLMEEWNIFARESAALSKIVPNIYRTLQEASGDPDKVQPFAAECYYSVLGSPVSAIVLQDLKELGFKMAERTKGLDFKHCTLVMKTLAKYHATSAVLYEETPELFEPLQENVFQERNLKDIEKFYAETIRNLADTMKKWPEFDEMFAKKIKDFSEMVTVYVLKSYQRQDGDFNVLIHGDLWLNNMMFRYSESTAEVQDVRFVDYQLSNLTNAAFDLHYFLYTSPSPELINKYQTLIEEYHKTLGETFTLLGQKHLHPTMEQLNKELDKKGLFAVVAACCVLPIVLVDQNEVPDMEKVIKKEESIQFSKLYRETLLKLLPVFEEKGWLEVNKFI